MTEPLNPRQEVQVDERIIVQLDLLEERIQVLRIRFWCIVTALMVFAVAGPYVAYRDSAARTRQASQTHTALCSFRGDLAQRHASLQHYLATNPEPTLFGVKRAVIENQLNGQAATLSSLGNLHC